MRTSVSVRTFRDKPVKVPSWEGLVWFGFGLASKVVLVALICFFPLLVNTIGEFAGPIRN